MENVSIYKMLVAAGMTPAGACGFMGNLQAESAMRSNNAQDGMSRLSDEEYTAAADKGNIDFVRDAVGYGFAQWTYWARKQNLLNFCKQRGKSVGDAKTQIDFCLHELKTEYKTLWKRLCSTDSVYDAAAIVCTNYERPAVNNIDVRAKFANNFYSEFAGIKVSQETKEEAKEEAVAMCKVELPIIKKGSKGGYVVALQAILNQLGYDCGKVDGDFGSKTEAAVKEFQRKYKLDDDGIVGALTWAALLKG